VVRRIGLVLIIAVGICVRSRSPRTDVLRNLQSSPFDKLRAGSSGLVLVGTYNPGLRPGLLSGVPSELVPTRPDSWLVFSKCCPNEPIEKANLDKSALIESRTFLARQNEGCLLR
jgi:hypothetical protein